MPLPKPNLYPSFNILRASHLELAVRDLAASRAFYVEMLGLQVTSENAEFVALRAMEERTEFSLLLRRAGRAEAGALGFRVFAESDLAALRVFFEGRGMRAEMRDGALRAWGPRGLPMEFRAQMDRLPPIHQKYARYRGVRPLRIDHFNCFVPDVDEATQFAADLGFRVTEYTADEESGRLWAAWLHRKGTVHDIAFTNGAGPRLHHIAYWVPAPQNIIDLLDLMSTSGYLVNIERGPGRHGISNAFFLYVRDPDGHRVELYCSDYQTIDPDHEPIHWNLKDPQRQTLWGAPAPRSWFEEGSEFGGVAVVAPTLQAQPIVAP